MTRKQPKKRATPKPVEAWAIVEAGRLFCTLEIMANPLAIYRGVANAIDTMGRNKHRSLEVIPVRIVPIVKRTKRKERKK